MNEREKIIAFIGGDERQISAAEYFALKGYEVRIFGIGAYKGDVPVSVSVSRAVGGAGTVVLPLPTSKDGLYLNMPLCGEKITFEEALSCLEPEQTLIGGNLTPRMEKLALERGNRTFDCMRSDAFGIKNAVPTAEGALGIAIRDMKTTLFGSESLVIGYGRIGKVLANMLRAVGSRVTVIARKEADIALAGAMGVGSADYSSLCNLAGKADVIFNTVPAKVITKPVLACVKRGTEIIDLASLPGGVDTAEAEEAGVTVVRALSLPGKVAPVSAGRIMAESIENILLNREVRR